MLLPRREPILITCSLILTLATAEGWVAWRYLSGMQVEAKAARIAALEREVASKTAEINHLIFLRDAEHRSAQITALRTAAQVQAQAQLLAHPRALTADEELAEATAQAMLSSADVMAAPQGAAPLNPGDIDPKHLVNMANIMTGRPVAELTKIKGVPTILFRETTLADDDPIWQMLDAVQQAHALKEVVLVGKHAQSRASLVKGGVPSSLIRIQGAGDPAYTGTDGILMILTQDLRRKS